MINKRILITAGPTWVPIDSVRVISNIATGETGILLAQEAVRRGFGVTLLLGPCDCCCIGQGFKVVRFRFFDELRQRLKEELSSKK
jgi:phosphopantothenoylcysteine decarboxylase/phosphopantothenate--cysteine ligase